MSYFPQRMRIVSSSFSWSSRSGSWKRTSCESSDHSSRTLDPIMIDFVLVNLNILLKNRLIDWLTCLNIPNSISPQKWQKVGVLYEWIAREWGRISTSSSLNGRELITNSTRVSSWMSVTALIILKKWNKRFEWRCERIAYCHDTERKSSEEKNSLIAMFVKEIWSRLHKQEME